MIYTVTFNPAIDYIVRLDSFKAGATNRVTYEKVLGGGKGINVSIVLSNLGIKSTALGFLAGFTGDEIRRQLEGFGVAHAFISLEQGFSPHGGRYSRLPRAPADHDHHQGGA